MLRLLRELDQAEHPLTWNTSTKMLVLGNQQAAPMHLRVAQRAQGDGFVVIERGVHLLAAGERHLRHWRWRWWKCIGIAIGGLVVGLESLLSLIAVLFS